MKYTPFDHTCHDIAVVCGGKSAEREVSIASGKEVFNALKAEGAKAELVILEEDNVTFLEGKKYDIVFIAMHGAFGEDGVIQRELDLIGLPFTGSSPKACERAFDKLISKKMFVEAGVPTPKWNRIMPDTPYEAELRALKLHPPLVLKPVKGGSSQGVTIVRDSIQIPHAIQEALEYDGEVLVEQCIEGRELTVGLLDGKALPIIELRTAQEFYDYKAKYDDDRTEYLCPADLSDELTARIKELAEEAARCLGIEHFGRADFMLDKDGKPYALEVNVIPGFTSHSLLPKAAAKSGIPFGKLCLKILNMAWERYWKQ